MSRDVSTQTNNIVSQESTLRHDVKKLLADNQKLYDDNQRQIDCSIAHIAQINDLISQLQKARENNFKLSVALETAQQNCQIATDQNEKLKKMLGQAEIKEGKRLRQELEELQHENEVLQAKIQQHHFNASTMKKDRLSLENQIVLLERKLEKTQEGVTLLQDKIRLLLLENDNLKKQLLGKSIQIDILLSQLQHTIREVNSLRQQTRGLCRDLFFANLARPKISGNCCHLTHHRRNRINR